MDSEKIRFNKEVRLLQVCKTNAISTVECEVELCTRCYTNCHTAQTKRGKPADRKYDKSHKSKKNHIIENFIFVLNRIHLQKNAQLNN